MSPFTGPSGGPLSVGPIARSLETSKETRVGTTPEVGPDVFPLGGWGFVDGPRAPLRRPIIQPKKPDSPGHR